MYVILYIRTRQLLYENKMHVKGATQVRESAGISDCTEISCVRKVGEPRIRKLSAYETFWIYSIWVNNHSSTVEKDFQFFKSSIFKRKRSEVTETTPQSELELGSLAQESSVYPPELSAS